jgi:hypothetical protein
MLWIMYDLGFPTDVILQKSLWTCHHSSKSPFRSSHKQNRKRKIYAGSESHSPH